VQQAEEEARVREAEEKEQAIQPEKESLEEEAEEPDAAKSMNKQLDFWVSCHNLASTKGKPSLVFPVAMYVLMLVLVSAMEYINLNK
jgi:hypothetical protein